MIDLSDLHVFRTVVQAGGITRAAERLHRVQSNVTARIQKLEEDLGVTLFLREGKRLHLTATGQTLLEYADRLLDLAVEARAAVQGSTPRGILRLGAMESTAAVRLPRPMSLLQDRYPDLTIELHTGDPRRLTAALLSGDLDAALVTEPISDPRLGSRPVFEEELIIVAGLRHPPISGPSDVLGATMLAFHPGCPHRKRLEDWFTDSGIPIERVVEVASYHAILGCAVAGMGVAVMPRAVLESYSERDRLSIHELSPHLRPLRTVLIWRGQEMPVKVAAFLEALEA
ncbi:LysR substrate-binding domain-containing protein [Lacibacterium aquatile]|uniref:LysR substrate-binding domain-containing protein n=1 Tax=Lacibacterium aquatile TaxID=1168082 RepID=A0ABW5DQP3_9PROT